MNYTESIKSFFQSIYDKFMGIKPLPNENEKLIADLRAVKERIHLSEKMCDELTDEDLIDYASYELLAEKARLTHLLKLAKKRNLHF